MADIEHSGKIIAVKPGSVIVEVRSGSACGKCPSRENCALFESGLKTIEINTPDAQLYARGEEVTVFTAETNGWLGVFLGYILPLLAVLSTLIAGNIIQADETVTGVSALLILIPYYAVLWLFRGKISRHVVFSIKKA